MDVHSPEVRSFNMSRIKGKEYSTRAGDSTLALGKRIQISTSPNRFVGKARYYACKVQSSLIYSWVLLAQARLSTDDDAVVATDILAGQI